MRAILLGLLLAIILVEPASAAITIIASTIVAGISAVATGAAVGASMLLAAGVATAQWGIRKIQELTKPKGAGGGSGVPTPAETAINGGARTASHVMGWARLTPNDHMLAFVNVADGGSNRRLLNVIHVLSEGPCEGVRQIWIDDFLAMEGTPDGSNQSFTVPTTAPNRPDIPEEIRGKNWKEVYAEIETEVLADPKHRGRGAAHVEVMTEVVDRMNRFDFFRFLNIGRYNSRAVTNQPSDFRIIQGNIRIANWGPWVRAWSYPNGADVSAIQGHIGADPTIPYLDSYRFDGKCIVHIQPERSDGISPFTSGVPNVEYVTKGRKITWPGQTTPTWTENAAAIRYWFHTELEGIPPNKIDTPSFTEAFNKCEERVNFTTTDPATQTLLDEYVAKSPDANNNHRYTINGLFLQDPSFYAQYKTDMDMAWQGNVLDSRGKLLFRAGFQRPVAFRIGPHNTVDTITFTPQPAENDRINAVRAVVQQSLDDNFQPVDLPIVEDVLAIQKDGIVKEREIQGLRFIKYPLTALNILHIALRKNRSVARLTKVLQIDPTDFDGNTYDEINCLDFVPVTDPELGLVDAPYEIVSWRRNKDWTLNVNLQELPSDVYDDTLQVPPLQKRQLTIPDSTTPPIGVASDLAAVQDVYVLEDGSIFWGIKVSFTASEHSTEIDIANADGSYSTSHIIGHNTGIGEFTVPGEDTYTITARNVNANGRRSLPSSVEVTVSGSHLIPPAPRLDSFDIRGGNITMFFQPFNRTNFDIIGLEFRYRVRATTDTTAFPSPSLTEAQWDALPRLASDAVASSIGVFSVDLQIPFSGRYQIFTRSYTRQGLESNITHLGQFVLVGLQPAGGTSRFNTASEGTRSNMGVLWDADGPDGTFNRFDSQRFQIEDAAVCDRPDASALTFRDWNGQNGWPFGRETTTTWSIDPALEFETQGSYGLRYRLGAWSLGTENMLYTVNWQGKVNGVNVGASVSGGDGASPVTVQNINEVAMTVTINSSGFALYDIRAFWEVVV